MEGNEPLSVSSAHDPKQKGACGADYRLEQDDAVKVQGKGKMGICEVF